MTEYCMIFTTVDDAQQVRKITDALLSTRAAACVQIIPVGSKYHWKGNIESSPELLLQIKTRTALFAQCEKIIRENHGYETPQIIAIPIIAGGRDYLDWIKKETTETRERKIKKG